MNGLKFDFEKGDITINSSGTFDTATIDNQNVALIALSQVCRLTFPEIGAQIGSRLINAPTSSASTVLADARHQAESDGAKDVKIQFTPDNKLIFVGNYED